ncbi:MAG: penicillin-binding protein activator LpoB [Oscillatoriales cyanobacterium]|nr:MAG: penicillin-binding protein activator LpoB [Oscillatoriales cyanobacterium]
MKSTLMFRGANLLASVALTVGLSLPAVALTATSLSAAGAIASASPADKQTEKKRIVVLDFYYGNTSDTGYWSSYRGGAAGTGVSELVTNALVESGKYRIADRSQVSGSSSEVSVAQAVEIGKLNKVDAVIIGTVTQFNLETRRSSGGAFGIGGNSEETIARVKLSARIIDTATGDILGTAKGESEVKSRSGGGSVFGVGGSSSNSDGNALLSKAVEEAAGKLSTDIQAKF